MVEVYFEYLARKYHAKVLSCASLFCISTVLIAIIIPFIVGYVTNNFWVKYSTYYEQPNVLITGEILLHAEFSDNSIHTYSTVNAIQRIYSTTLMPAAVKYNAIKLPNGKFNQYRMQLSLPCDTTTLRKLSLAIGFNYSLSEKVRMIMQSPLVIDVDLPTGASEISINGDIELRQRNPFPVKLSPINSYNYSLFSIAGTSNTAKMQLTNIERNYSSSFSGSIDTTVIQSNKAIIDVNINAPQQKITYISTIWEVLKYSWIQYFYLAFPTFLLAHYVALTIFKTGLIPTQIIEEK